MGLTFNKLLRITDIGDKKMTLSDENTVEFCSGKPAGWSKDDNVVLTKQETPESTSTRPGGFSGVVHKATKIDKDGNKVGSPVAITPLEDVSTSGEPSEIEPCLTFKDFKRFDKESTIWKVKLNNILLKEDKSQWLLSGTSFNKFVLDWMPDEIVIITEGVSKNKGFAGKGFKSENRICEIKNITREKSDEKTKKLTATFVER